MMRKPSFHEQAMEMLRMAVADGEKRLQWWAEEVARLRIELAKEEARATAMKEERYVSNDHGAITKGASQ